MTRAQYLPNFVFANWLLDTPPLPMSQIGADLLGAATSAMQGGYQAFMTCRTFLPPQFWVPGALVGVDVRLTEATRGQDKGFSVDLRVIQMNKGGRKELSTPHTFFVSLAQVQEYKEWLEGRHPVLEYMPNPFRERLINTVRDMVQERAVPFPNLALWKLGNKVQGQVEAHVQDLVVRAVREAQASGQFVRLEREVEINDPSEGPYKLYKLQAFVGAGQHLEPIREEDISIHLHTRWVWRWEDVSPPYDDWVFCSYASFPKDASFQQCTQVAEALTRSVPLVAAVY